MTMDYGDVNTNKRHPLPDGPVAVVSKELPTEAASGTDNDLLEQRRREFDNDKRYRVRFTVTTKDENAKPAVPSGWNAAAPAKTAFVYYPPLGTPGVSRLQAEVHLLDWYVRKYHNESDHRVVGPDLQPVPPILPRQQ